MEEKVILMFISVFVYAIIYSCLDKEDFSGNIDKPDLLNGLYLSSVVQSSIGFGDVYPVSTRAKILVTSQALVTLLLFSVKKLF